MIKEMNFFAFYDQDHGQHCFAVDPQTFVELTGRHPGIHDQSKNYGNHFKVTMDMVTEGFRMKAHKKLRYKIEIEGE